MRSLSLPYFCDKMGSFHHIFMEQPYKTAWEKGVQTPPTLPQKLAAIRKPTSWIGIIAVMSYISDSAGYLLGEYLNPRGKGDPSLVCPPQNPSATPAGSFSHPEEEKIQNLLFEPSTHDLLYRPTPQGQRTEETQL